MPTLEELRTEYDQVRQTGLDLAKMVQEAGGVPTPEQFSTMEATRTRFEELKGELKTSADFAASQGLFQADVEVNQERARTAMPDIYGGPAVDLEAIKATFRTPGDHFAVSDAYRGWMARFPEGGPSVSGNYQADQVVVKNFGKWLGLYTKTDRMRMAMAESNPHFRALVTSADASAGLWVRPDFRGLLEPGLVRPLTVRDLVTVLPTTSDAIQYVRENSRISGAAPVSEATALTGTSGSKPEGGLTFALVEDVVKTIAEWVPATKRILMDATGLRAYIDQFLLDDIATELEDQMVAGSGGDGFIGILNTAGVQTTAVGASPLQAFDAFLVAKSLIQVNARTTPTGILIHPTDLATVEGIKDGNDQYIGAGPFGSPNPTYWGMRVIPSEAVPLGTALVGDFRRAVLFDREQTTITVGTANDDFIRNIVRILGELRAGFGVLRPAAFCTVTNL